MTTTMKNINRITITERPELKKVVEYTGNNKFVKEIAEKYQKWGSLTDKQITVAVAQVEKEEEQNRVVKLRMPTPGETILIGRYIGQKLKETYGLEFNPTLIDITKLLGMSAKAVKFSGKMTIKRGNICMCCGRELTDEFSMLTKMGKTCARHMRVEYIKDKSEVERFRNDYLKRVEEIGEMEFWVPKSQIKKWDGARSIMLEMF